MGLQRALFLAMILGVPGGALAQPPTAQPSPEPALLKLPMGARVRLQTAAAPGSWLNGVLVSADATSVALVPENAPPLGANQLVVPSTSVAQLELATGRKRHWLPGLLAGVAVGLALGLTEEVDPVRCEYDYATSCNRAEAVIVDTLAMGGLGALVGALIKTDRWTPVALDALAPPRPRVSGAAPHLRARPGGVELGLTVGF